MSGPIRSGEQLLAAARAGSGHNVVAVAMADDAAVLQAVVEARQEGIVDAILIGNIPRMEEIASSHRLNLSGCRMEHTEDPAEASRMAVQLVADGTAHFLMKGFVKTAVLLKALLAEPTLKVREVLSHVAVLDIPGRDRLLLFTDGGMIPLPDRDQLNGMIHNLLDMADALAIRPFSFGFLAPYHETRNEDHEAIGRSVSRPDAIFRGDVPVETAFTELDGVIATAIEECNVITKGLTHFTDALFSGLIMGTRAPICLVSRSDSARNKKASLALGVLAARGGAS